MALPYFCLLFGTPCEYFRRKTGFRLNSAGGWLRVALSDEVQLAVIVGERSNDGCGTKDVL